MELTVRNPAPPVSTLPMPPKGIVPVNHAQLAHHTQAKKEEDGNGNAINGFSASSAPHADSASTSAAPGAVPAPNDPLRYTVTEPTPTVKSELVDGQVSGTEVLANNASEESKPSTTPAAKKDDSDSESSSVSDDDDVDTSTWTNSIMSLYEDVRCTTFTTNMHQSASYCHFQVRKRRKLTLHFLTLNFPPPFHSIAHQA